MAIESFSLGDKNFRMPGLGSFLAAAASRGDFGAIGWGLGVLITVIVLLDLLVWRPLIAWAEKFKYESVEAQSSPHSAILDFLRRSPTLRTLGDRLWRPLREGLDQRVNRAFTITTATTPVKQQRLWLQWLGWLFTSGVAVIVLWGTWEAVLMLRLVAPKEWGEVLGGAAFTALRVIAALVLSLLWTVPVGVTIGRNPRLAQILQPLVQIAASVPATALFPVLLLGLIQFGGGLTDWFHCPDDAGNHVVHPFLMSLLGHNPFQRSYLRLPWSISSPVGSAGRP
ncbi:hypothetical protein [Neosynechococcus sphagnicola]|uniref:hypothetical protein n=1 Tax=Neosynechococcus sphagnicola TaxID=1501145 RepID=UPI000B0EFC78|nr:hypothetical protein [Neosynechococcus sphagnicola]